MPKRQRNEDDFEELYEEIDLLKAEISMLLQRLHKLEKKVQEVAPDKRGAAPPWYIG